MIVLMYLVALPLWVSTLAVLYGFLDGQQGARVLKRLAMRIVIMLLMYIVAGNAALVALIAAAATICVLHMVSFWGLRLAVAWSRRSG